MASRSCSAVGCGEPAAEGGAEIDLGIFSVRAALCTEHRRALDRAVAMTEEVLNAIGVPGPARPRVCTPEDPCPRCRARGRKGGDPQN